MRRAFRSFLTVLLFFGWLPEATSEVIEQDPPLQKEIHRVALFPVLSNVKNMSTSNIKQITERLMQTLRKESSLKVKSVYPFVGGKKPITRKKQANPIKKAKLLAQKTFSKILTLHKSSSDYELVLRKVKKGIRILEKTLIWEGSTDLIARLRVLGTISLLQLGKNSEAEAFLKALAVISPQTSLPELQKNRVLKFRYKFAKQAIQNLPKVGLQLQGTPNAAVYVNGKKQGVLPLSVPDLVEGRYYLRIVKKGYLPFTKVISLSSQQTIQAFLRLKKKAKSSVLVGLASQLKRHILEQTLTRQDSQDTRKKLCQKLPIDWFFTLVINEGDGDSFYATPSRVKCSTNEVEQLSVQEIKKDFLSLDDSIPKIKKGLLSFLAPPVIKLKNPILLPKKPKKKKLKKKSRAWVWALVTVGAVGVAGGVTAAVLLTRPPRLKVKVQWNP